MAEVDTIAIEKDLSDIRREAVAHTNEIVKEGLKGVDVVVGATTGQTTQLLDRFFAVGRDSADLRAQVTGLGYQVRDGFTAAAKDAEINALKTQIEMAKQTTYLSDKIDSNERRIGDLIQGLHDGDQNRALIERNAELVAAVNDGRWWRDWGNFRGAWDGNNQVVSSRLNALDSQFAETRQGMVNFGTMAGVGQTSTNNNVK